MKPAFVLVKQNFPRRDVMPRVPLLTSIGWTDVLNNPAFNDTCAVRMSIALISSGVSLPGARMKINAGALKGKWIEPGQGKLPFLLKRLWGKPEVFKSEDAARDGIGKRSGVASFFRIHGGGPADGGHIDLVWPTLTRFSDCASSCFFEAPEIWFWSLK